MIREQMCFHYANISAKDQFGIINVNVTVMGSDGYSEPLVLSNSEIKELINPKISKNYFQYKQKTPISFSMDLALIDGETWTQEKLRAVTHWLCDHQYYQPLWFDNYPDIIYSCICVNQPIFNHNGNGQGFCTIEFRLQYPFAQSAMQGTDFDYDISSGSKLITIPNNGNTTTYPEIWIHKLGAGSVSISNLTDGGNTLQFLNAQNSSGILTVNGTIYDGEKIIINNQVLEIDTGDGSVGTHIETVGGSPVSNIKIPFNGKSAEGILAFHDGYVEDGNTITVGSDTYEFDTDGVYSYNDINVDISKYVTDASWNYLGADKIYQCIYTLKIQDTQYNFEQGTDADVLKLNHKIPADIDLDVLNNYRIINVGQHPEFQTSGVGTGYVDRTIFHNMEPIGMIDSEHLYIPQNIIKQRDNFYLSNPSQTPNSDTNKQLMNFYLREETNITLVAWETDGGCLFVPDGTVSSNMKPGTILELQTGNIYDANNNLAYQGRTMYVGIQKIQTSATWKGFAISRIFLMSYVNGPGTNSLDIENDMKHFKDTGNVPSYYSSTDPLDFWYTDSFGNGIDYPSGYHFPSNRWETTLTHIANITITAVINKITTTDNVPLLDYDLTNPRTVKCGATVTDTMNNLVKAINASGIAGTDYSQDIVTANQYVSAELLTATDGSPYIKLSSKVKGQNGNNISVKVYNNVKKMYPTYPIKFYSGSDCTQDEAIKCLVKAMALNYQINPNFTADIDRYYPVHLDSNGNVVRLAVNADTDPSSIQIDSNPNGRNYLTNNVLTVRAMIAGKRGNDIMVASNCPIATWGEIAGELEVSLYGGDDPPANTSSDIYNIMTTIVNTMNANSNGQYTASILNSSQIQVTWNTVGRAIIPVSETCFNITWDSDTLTGGIDELQDGETGYVNCKEGEEAIESSLSNTYRYDSCNQNYLRLVYGENRLQVTGSCYLRIYWQNRFL